MPKILKLFALIGFVLLIAACGGNKDEAQVEAPPRYSTRTPLPTSTPSPTPFASPVASETPALAPTDAGSTSGGPVENVEWNTTTTLGAGSVDHAYWTLDNKHLIVSGGRGLQWLSFDPLLEDVQQQLPGYFAPLALTEDGLFAVTQDGTITYLDADLKPTPIDKSAGAWTDFEFSPDGSTLAALGDSEILLIDVAERDIRRRLLYDAEVEILLDMGYAPDGVLLAILTHQPNLDSLETRDTFLRVMDAEAATLRWSLEGPVAQIARADLNGQYLRVSDPLLPNNPNDFSPRFVRATLYDITTFEPLESVTMRDYWDVVVSHNGKLMASQSNSNSWLIMYDLPSGRQVFESAVIGGSSFSSFDNPSLAVDMRFSPDDSKLVLVNGASQIIVVDMESQEAVARWLSFSTQISDLAFAPDGKTLAVAGINYTTLYPLTEQAEDAPPYIPLPQTGSVISVNYSADGTHLATGSTNDGALLWDVATLDQPTRLSGVDHSQFLAFLPDGTRLIDGGTYVGNGFDGSGDVGVIRTWDLTGISMLPAYGDIEAMEGTPRGFALSPDGTRLVVTTYNGVTSHLYQFDTANGRGLGDLAVTGYVLNGAVFAADNTHVYVGGSDGYIRVFEVGTDILQTVEYALPTPVEVTALALHDTTLAIGQADGGVTWLELTTGAVLYTIPNAHMDGVTALDFAPDGTLASGGVDGLTHLWQLGTPEIAAATDDATPESSLTTSETTNDATPETPAPTTQVTYVEKGHYGEGTVSGVVFSPDSQQLVLAAAGGSTIYRVPDLTTAINAIPNLSGAIVTSPDGTWLVGTRQTLDSSSGFSTGERGRIMAVSLTQEPVEIRTHFDSINAIHFSPDGTTLAVNGYVWGMEDYTQYIEVYSFPAGELLHTFEYESEYIAGMAYLAPDQLLLALFTRISPDDVAPEDAPLRIVEAFSNTERTSLMLEPLAFAEVVFSPDGTYFHLNAYRLSDITGSAGYSLEPIDQPLVRLVSDGSSVNVPGETAPIFAFSNDSHLYAFLSFSEQAQIRMVDIESGEVIHEVDLRGDSNGRGSFFIPTTALWFSPDDATLAILSSNGSVTLIDIESGERIASSSAGGGQPIQAVAASPDGQYVVSGSLSNLQLWDTATGAVIANNFAFGQVSVLEFAPNSQQIGIGTLGGNGTIWNFPLLIEAMQNADTTFFGQDRVGLNGLDYVMAVAYNSDGTRFVTAGYYPRRRDDRTPLIRTWDLTTTPVPLPAAPDIEGLPGVPSAIALSPNDQILAVATEGSTEILLFDAMSSRETGKLVSTNNTLLVDIAFLPDGGRLLALYSDGGLSIFDVASQAVVSEWAGSLEPNAEGLFTTFYMTMTLNAEGTQLVGGRNDGLISVWDILTGAVVAEFQASETSVNTIAFDTEGQLIVGAQDGIIRVWGVE